MAVEDDVDVVLRQDGDRVTVAVGEHVLVQGLVLGPGGGGDEISELRVYNKLGHDRWSFQRLLAGPGARMTPWARAAFGRPALYKGR